MRSRDQMAGEILVRPGPQPIAAGDGAEQLNAHRPLLAVALEEDPRLLVIADIWQAVDHIDEVVLALEPVAIRIEIELPGFHDRRSSQSTCHGDPSANRGFRGGNAGECS